MGAICFVGSSFPPEDGHLHGEIKDLLLAEGLLHSLLDEAVDAGINLADFSQGLEDLGVVLKGVEGSVLVPLNDQLPAGLGSQLLQLVIKMEILPADGAFLALAGLLATGFEGKGEEVVLASIAPDAHSQETSLLGDFPETGHHLFRVGSGLEDQVGDDPVELVNSLEGGLTIVDADLEALPLLPLIDVIANTESVDVVSEEVASGLDHLLAEVSGQVGAVFGLEADGVGDESACSAADLVDVPGLVELEHVDEGVVEGLHDRVVAGVGGGYSVPEGLGLLDGARLRLVLHKICYRN